MLIGAMVAVWVVIVFARQVGAASAATARAEQMATDNAALTTQVDAMARELSLIQQPGFVQQAARAYGLGGRKEIAFALAPDAPPLADDAPGLGEPSGRFRGCAGQSARPLADAPVRPRRLTLGAPAGHAGTADLEPTPTKPLAHNRPLTETATGGRAAASLPPHRPAAPGHGRGCPAGRSAWARTSTTRKSGRPTTSPSTGSGWTSSRSPSPPSGGS